ncbi:MAG: hypothetical protein RL398_2401 [Planctomycetota bacterium]|jgi:hypothetical protein
MQQLAGWRAHALRVVVATGVAAAACWLTPLATAQGRPEPSSDQPTYRSFNDLTPTEQGARRTIRELAREGIFRRALPLHPVAITHYLEAKVFPRRVLAGMRLPTNAASPDRTPDDRARIWRGALLDGTEVFAARLPIPEVPTNDFSIAWFDPETEELGGSVLGRTGMIDQWGYEPRIFQVDLDEDGRMEVVLDVLHHNGTIENRYVRHYLLPHHGRLRAVLTHHFEVKLIDSPNEGGFLYQMPIRDRPGRLQIYTWYENATVAPLCVPVGLTTVERGEDGVYREVARRTLLPGAECWIELPAPSFDELR